METRGTEAIGAILMIPASCRADTPLPAKTTVRADRSEEHTSELQSLMRISYAVFCLKKTKKTTTGPAHATRAYDKTSTVYPPVYSRYHQHVISQTTMTSLDIDTEATH